ncbi:hypothetical protein A0H81_05663 [Grifola frondosa]|uniref:Uncharacterized protein n=1 Tax=Grifola frondosa TaxID=5627 RepID=A0A1C7MDH5_GRIFR|nr:hypothetical protein A0H81_05663 [Grifola frondosa]
MPPWKKMPCDVEDLSQWLVVDTLPERRDGVQRTMVLYHSGLYDSEEDDRYEVVLRLQGIVEELNIAPLGNWNGQEHDAPKAVQSMTLGHGGIRTPFEAQNEGLNALQDVVRLYLGVDAGQHEPLDSSIKVRRRVFTRVRPTYPSSRDSVLRHGDDPFGHAGKVSSRWVVLHKINTGVRGVDGKLRQCGHIVIRKGDFVDVSVFVELYKRHTQQGVKVEMNLAMNDVVRLYSAREMKDLFQRGNTVSSTRMVGFATGFSFEDDGAVGANGATELREGIVDDDMVESPEDRVIELNDNEGTQALGTWGLVGEALPSAN